MTIDECGIVACEPYGRTGHVNALTRTPDWLDSLKDRLHSFRPSIRLIVRQTECGAKDRSSYGSRADTIHADALFTQFSGCASGQLDDSCFARGVHMRSI